MSRYDDDYPQRAPRGRPRAPEERRDPYEAQRQVRTFGADDEYAAERPWRAAHPQRDAGGERRPRWSEQPERYGGGYRDDELWSTPRGERDDARYGLDTDNERRYAQGMQDPDNRHRAHGYGRSDSAWQGQRDYGRDFHDQNNSGYDAARSYGQGRYQDDAGSDRARASWTQEHDYEGPRYASSRPRRDVAGSQYARTDTYGGAGFRQQGKRYWFDEGDQRSQFRGTRPRGYERSDERLRELACERLTDAEVDASDIEVKVEQGTVTLEGSVPARWMKHQAEDIIDDLGGVRDIQNHLRVSRGEAEAPAAPGTSASSRTASSNATGGITGQGGDAGRSRH